MDRPALVGQIKDLCIAQGLPGGGILPARLRAAACPAASSDLLGPQRFTDDRVPVEADEVSAFIVIAARLIQIKSEALLPRPPVRQSGEEDPGDALARQLIAYKRYRQIADLLSDRVVANLRTYLRIAPPPKLEGTVDLSGITLENLSLAASIVFSQAQVNDQIQNIVPIARVSIREKIASVANALRLNRQITFQTLLTTQHTPLEIVVTFLALLELVKRQLVWASQEQIFGDIQITASETWNENEEFELEFGE